MSSIIPLNTLPFLMMSLIICFGTSVVWHTVLFRPIVHDFWKKLDRDGR